MNDSTQRVIDPTNDTRVIDPYLIVKVADNPEKFVAASTLGGFIRTPKQAMFLVKLLGDEIIDKAACLGRIFNALNLGSVADAISAGGHSTELQTWLEEAGLAIPVPDEETVVDDGAGPQDFDADDDLDTLVDLVNTALVKLPASLKELSDGLFLEVLSKQPTGQAHYVLDHVMQVSKFGQIGTVKTQLEYEVDTNAVLVVDCSGSMGMALGQAIAEPVVRLANDLKCDLILVSTNAVKFPAGTFTVDTVLDNWQNGWTYYNQLIPFFRDITQSYDAIVTIADYDSHAEHKSQIARECAARAQVLYDINVQYTTDYDGNIRTSFLAECLGQLADRVVPVFVGAPGLDYSRSASF